MSKKNEYNIVINQGSTFFLSVSIENDEGYILDIKQCLALMQVRELKSHLSNELFDITPYIEFTKDNRLIIEIPGDVTSTFEWKKGFYDLRIKEINTNRIYKILEGEVSVIDRVSDNHWSKAAKFNDTCTIGDDI